MGTERRKRLYSHSWIVALAIVPFSEHGFPLCANAKGIQDKTGVPTARG